jgi:Leucine-rich repeat (LRR) protein
VLAPFSKSAVEVRLDQAFWPLPDWAVELGVLGGYRLLRVLGEGGMGVVFEAQDLGLERRVALKAMDPTLAADQEARRRFLREARLVAALEHDHIVAIHQVGEERALPFLVMPLLRGENLESRLSREHVLNCSEAIRIGREVALGLAAAHASGVVHRDVKPSNVWLEEDSGRVKVLDFGLARPIEGDSLLSEPHALAGTPAYMAPEQLRGGAVDGRTDLFALGCLLYQMCTGISPFQRATVMATFLAAATEQPSPPAKLRAAVPAGLSDFVMRLLRKDPAERPQSAVAASDQLSCWGQQVPTTLSGPHAVAEPGPGSMRTRAWLRRLAAIVVLAIVAPAMFLTGAVLGRFATRAPEPFRVGGFDINASAADSRPANRRLAEWILARGGSVTVPGLSGEKEIRGTEELPESVYISEVNLAGYSIREEDIRRLSAATGLWRFAADGRQLSEAGVARLAEFQGLRELSIGNLQHGDDCARRLAELRDLTLLDVTGSHLSDAGFELLAKLTPLRELGLSGTGIGDTGLALLRPLRNLKVLRLADGGITNLGLNSLRSFHDLESLDLSGTKVDDAGIAQLKELPKLRRLCLNATRVTDVAIDSIASCRLLFQLELRGARVSSNGRAALEKFLPGSQLQWSEPNRTAAESVLGAGGTVRVRTRAASDERVVEKLGGLPAGYFLLTSVQLARAGKLPADLPEKLTALRDPEFDGLTAVDLAIVGLDAKAVDGVLQVLPATIVDLSLAGTRTGDAQARVCAERLKHLLRVDLSGTQVTAAGIDALRTALPNCNVSTRRPPKDSPRP